MTMKNRRLALLFVWYDIPYPGTAEKMYLSHTQPLMLSIGQIMTLSANALSCWCLDSLWEPGSNYNCIS